MHTRALGKALGRRPRYPGRPRASLMLIMAGWTLLVGFASERAAAGGPLPAFHQVEQVEVRKQRFLDYLTPMIRSENELIRRQRSELLEIARLWRAGEPLGWFEHRYLEWLAGQYLLNADETSPGALIDTLLVRVDVVPLSLVLAQAAKESGWGCSRFARRANNLFGQWCFQRGCGVVPRDRAAGMSHEVRRFETVRDSVASYMQNLNTHGSYQNLRTLRARLRAEGLPLSGLLLAEGLDAYSERGDRYVRELQSMIRQNGLEADGYTDAVVGS